MRRTSQESERASEVMYVCGIEIWIYYYYSVAVGWVDVSIGMGYQDDEWVECLAIEERRGEEWKGLVGGDGGRKGDEGMRGVGVYP